MLQIYHYLTGLYRAFRNLERLEAAQAQLAACRKELEAQTQEVARLHGRNARLSWQLFQADSLHLCAGETKRCYNTDVLVDAGSGEHN